MLSMIIILIAVITLSIAKLMYINGNIKAAIASLVIGALCILYVIYSLLIFVQDVISKTQ